MTSGDLFGLDNRVVAVIGAGSGIGEAVARGAAQQGAHLICLDVAEDAASRTVEHIRSARGLAEVQALDITDSAAVDRSLDGIVATYGRLDAVVCTPAINVRKKIVDYGDDEFDRVVRVNLKGTFNVLRAAGRVLMPLKGGSIVLFSSIRSQVVEPGQSVYAMTKAGVVQLVRTAAAEFGPSGVRVNAIGPGVVETPLTAQIKAKPDWYEAYANKSVFRRWASADEMVGPTLFLISSAASYVTGTVLFADGGWLAADGRFSPPGM
jgi:NAD(P)-dependent dehydrogenase (short-subunit alcohol dehydrogenase family)